MPNPAPSIQFTRLESTVDKIASVPKGVYYAIGYDRSNLPAGYRVFLCVARRDCWVDITGGFGRQELHALAGAFRRLGRWTQTVDWWLEGGVEPNGTLNVQSNIIPFPLPVQPFSGPFTTRNIAADPIPFTYTGTGVGRVFDLVRLDGVSFYFKHGQRLETGPLMRGLDCTTFPMALFEVSVDARGVAEGQNLAAERIAQTLGAVKGDMENKSREEIRDLLFGLEGDDTILRMPREGLYLLWRVGAAGAGHIMVYKGEKDRARYGIHEFTGSGNNGAEWRAVGYRETGIRKRSFMAGTYCARRIPSAHEWRVVNTALSDYFVDGGSDFPSPQVTIGQSGPVGRLPAGGGNGGGQNGSHYTVVSGDSLSLIAGRYWGDVLLWPILYDANKRVVGGDPNRIYPGQKLSIPNINGYSQAQRDAARARGRA